MAKQSAGLVLYRKKDGILEIFLVHPGGPFWTNKDLGAWSIPKGEFAGEDPLKAAKREFAEETGFKVSGPFIELRPIKQKSGKWVYAWAVKKDVDPSKLKSNLFTVKLPFGGEKEYPEVDRAGWFPVEVAVLKINPAQASLISQLQEKLAL